MQIANVKHSHCEAKFGFRVWETKFGCVHRETEPTGPGENIELPNSGTYLINTRSHIPKENLFSRYTVSPPDKRDLRISSVRYSI